MVQFFTYKKINKIVYFYLLIYLKQPWGTRYVDTKLYRKMIWKCQLESNKITHCFKFSWPTAGIESLNHSKKKKKYIYIYIHNSVISFLTGKRNMKNTDKDFLPYGKPSSTNFIKETKPVL